MAATAKVVFFFGGKKWGWTETWYWVTSSGNISNALGDATLYIKARRALLSGMYSLEAARIEATDTQGNTFTLGSSQIAYNRVGAGVGELEGACSNPWTSLLLRYYGGATLGGAGFNYAKNHLLRGIPDDMLCIDSAYVVPPTIPPKLKLPLDTYRVLTTTPIGGAKPGPNPPIGSFSMRSADKPNGKGKSVYISDVEIDADGAFKITTSAPVTITTIAGTKSALEGDYIHLHNIQGPWARGLNGDCLIKSVDNLSYVVNKFPQNNCTISYNQRGEAWGIAHLIIPTQESEISRYVVRKTGGPFFGTRGRRRKR